MSPPSDPRDKNAPAERDDRRSPDDHGDSEDRAAIMARRAMFIASAIAGLNLASCEGTVETEPQPCLDMGTTSAGGAGGYQPCLSQGGYGGEPQPCLTMQPTTGVGGTGGEPQPCLEMGGIGGAGGGGMGGGGSPQPCLAPPPPSPKGSPEPDGDN